MFHLWTNQPVSAWLVLFFVVVFVIVSFLFVCLFGGCESLCWIACLFETRFAVQLWLALYSQQSSSLSLSSAGIMWGTHHTQLSLEIAGEMAQSLTKVSAVWCELRSQHPHTESGVVHTPHPSTQRQRGQAPQALSGQPVQPIGELQQETLSQKIRWTVTRRHMASTYPHMGVHTTHTCTHHTHKHIQKSLQHKKQHIFSTLKSG